MAFTITTDHLVAIAQPKNNKATDLMNGLVPWINKICPEFEIDTANEYAHFLAQACHESAGFSTTVEGLNYSAEGLLKTFPKYFNAQLANQFARKPELIASHVYANRMGNGDENSRDGWKFRGRGIFQNTGKDQYVKLGAEKSDPDFFVRNPEKLEQPEFAVWSACVFWKNKGLTNIANHADTDLLKYKKFVRKGNVLVSQLIDLTPVEYISRSINGGENGLAERKKNYLIAKKVLV